MSTNENEDREPEFSDDELRARASVAESFSNLAYLFGLSVEDALRPALNGRRVETCLHMHTLFSTRRTSDGRFVPEEGSRDRQVFVCAIHPHGTATTPQLFCQEDVRQHYETEHHGDYDSAVCAVCETPIRVRARDGSGYVYRGDFTPVFGVIELLKPLPVQFLRQPRGRDWAVTNGDYLGDITTTAVTHLCPEHAGSVDLPLRYQWPAGDPTPVEPEEQSGPPQAPF